MQGQEPFHVLMAGWKHTLLERLLNRIALKSDCRFSYVMHPEYSAQEWRGRLPQSGVHFFREYLTQPMPEPDKRFLASLEQDGVPTIHNMIMGDSIVSKLRYSDALGYATFLARRMFELFAEIKPSVIVGGFDGIHGSLALAVARRLGIPWFALQFSVIPAGLAVFCDRMVPSARVLLAERPAEELHGLASVSLRDFENRRIQAPAYIAPLPLPLAGKIARLPERWRALRRTIRNSRSRRFLQFTEAPPYYSVTAAIEYFRRAAKSRKALSKIRALERPPASPYVLFGLHLQPEVSTDVWASYFSNQMWVIELLSRSIPATHKLVVKVHKSDAANYSAEQYAKMQSFPGVELVAPFADTREFIEKADLIVSIQGTMGLEAGLIGKPAIMLGDSPFTILPSVTRIGEITDLPALMRQKLAEPPPARAEILDAYASFLAPYLPASYNDWRLRITDSEIDQYALLFDALRRYVNNVQRIPLN